MDDCFVQSCLHCDNFQCVKNLKTVEEPLDDRVNKVLEGRRMMWKNLRK